MGSSATGGWACLPFMTARRAAPPDALVRRLSNGLWVCVLVAGGVPLGQEFAVGADRRRPLAAKHAGQPVPCLVRDSMRACHSCPQALQRHQAGRPEPGLSANGKILLCRHFLGVGDPGLEPGTSSLSENVRGNLQSSPVVNNAANRQFLGDVSRPETTALGDLVHPKCTLVGPPGFAAHSLTAKDSPGAASGTRASSP